MATFESHKILPRRNGRSWLFAAASEPAREYAPTFAAEFAVLACQILVYKLAAHSLGKQGFSEYAVARRAISTIYPVCLLGLATALPRYIAYATRSKGSSEKRYFGASLWCVSIATACVLALINIFPRTFAFLVFGEASYASLAAPMSLVIVGLIIHALGYAYFRGHLKMTQANCLQLVDLGIVPLAVFLFITRSVGAILAAMGVATVCIALIALALMPWTELATNTMPEAQTLLRYGVPRVPGDFAQMGLLGLPAFLVAHFAGLQQAGYVAFAMSFLVMISAAFSPIGSILLPKASRMMAEGTRAELRAHVWTLARITVGVSAIMISLTYLGADELIRLYLGPGFGDVARIVRLLCLGSIPYSLFLVLRNVIDAHHERAVSSSFLVISFGVFLAGSGLVFLQIAGWTIILFSFLAAMFVLGALTCAQTARILSEQSRIARVGARLSEGLE